MTQSSQNTRRDWLKHASGIAASAAVLSAPSLGIAAASEKIVVGIMGVNGRGSSLAETFSSQAGCEIAYICDVDRRAIERVVGAVGKRTGKTPKGVEDFRHILDDASVDALVVATPNHWHAPATIAACNANKHVYVEKPCSHNPAEGEWMVAAARKKQRVVTMGTQRRSWVKTVEAIDRVKRGDIGEVTLAVTWYNSRRGSIGKGDRTPAPDWLNYDLWQGPAPERPFVSNLVHYQWHWRWHWGNGELGNNGVHGIDVARWGLGVDYPIEVGSSGAKLEFVDDDQETPDTHTVSMKFPGEKMILWQGLSRTGPGPYGTGFGVSFHGTKGTLVLLDREYKIFDKSEKELESVPVVASEDVHVSNFLDCIRSGSTPNAEIAEGHKSTLLCHLGNIAFRLGETLYTDPATGRPVKIRNSNEPHQAAMAHWEREYRPGWKPVVG